jgi:hypothetical protein
VTSDTFNPILERSAVPFWHIVWPSMLPPRNRAYVFVQPDGQCTVVGPNDSAAAWRTRWGIYDLRYTVDTRSFLVSFECVLPSNDDAIEFRADVQLICRVGDPATIVRRDFSDAAAALQPALTRTMSQKTRDCGIGLDQRTQTENRIRDVVQSHLIDGERLLAGFAIKSFMLRLGLCNEERDHVRGLRQIDRDIERETKEAKLWRLRDNNDIERRKISIAFYNDLVQRGYGHLVLLYLAHHPDQIQGVVHMLVQMRRDEQRHWLSALDKLQASDVLEEHHLQQLRDYIFQQLTERKQQEIVLEGLTQAKNNGSSLN